MNSHTQESLGLGEEVAVPLCRKLVCLEKSYMTLNELLQCCKSFFHKEICPEYNTAANVIFKHSLRMQYAYRDVILNNDHCKIIFSQQILLKFVNLNFRMKLGGSV